MIELAAADGHTFSAYRVDPEGTPRGAVIVLQEMFGVNEHIRAVADRFATAGYVAIAPVLFDRARRGATLGYDAASAEEGLKLQEEVGTDAPIADIQAAIELVRDLGKVGVVGYGWGGYLAYAAGNRASGLACAVAYYGTGIAGDFWEKRKVPTLLHFGSNDTAIPFADVQQFRARRPDVSAYGYEAGHGFNCDGQPGYDEGVANVALERTLFWMSQYVEGQAPVALKNAGAYLAAKPDKKKKKVVDDQGPPME
jgi:carboxymethylenebutenolidase